MAAGRPYRHLPRQTQPVAVSKDLLSGFRPGDDSLMEMSDTDLQLLARYTGQHAEDAFSEIVRRHLNLVYSAALRQVRSPQLAEEVAQSVFTDLARQAERLAPDTILSAWLYQVTRRSAIDVVRREARRQHREQVAIELAAMNATTADWTEIEPLLDEAMHSLDETDRAAVLLRYFETKSLQEVGQALATTEDAARKRVSRAVDRLREFFASRGVSVGAGGLVVAISANAVQAAPVGLTATISATALAGKVVATTATAKAIAVTTKSGAAAKGAATLGGLGGLLALLGGAFITLRAQAGDTKSPRERRFVLQMIGVRVVTVLLVLAAFYCIGRPSSSRQPFVYDVVFAGSLLVFTVLYTVLFDYTSRHRRRIQIEDGTWVETEWTTPRREAEVAPDGGPHTSKFALYLKGSRFLAVVLVQVLIAAVVVVAVWEQGWVRATAILTALGLTVFWAFRDWLNRPRFQSLRLDLLAIIGGTACGLTLMEFNVHQYESGLWGSNGKSAAALIGFNVATVLFYTTFIAVFARRRN